MVAEFLTELHLLYVTLVCDDWGGAQLVISPGGSDRVAKLVLVSYETFDSAPLGSEIGVRPHRIGVLDLKAARPFMRDLASGRGEERHRRSTIHEMRWESIGRG